MTEKRELDFLIQIAVDRDSVSMGDDIESHDKIIQVAALSNPVIFIKKITSQYNLPIIAGVGHTWDCLLNDVLIVSIKGNCVEFIPKVTTISFQENNEIFFKYHADIH
jgi:hypothetical protein